MKPNAGHRDIKIPPSPCEARPDLRVAPKKRGPRCPNWDRCAKSHEACGAFALYVLGPSALRLPTYVPSQFYFDQVFNGKDEDLKASIKGQEDERE